MTSNLEARSVAAVVGMVTRGARRHATPTAGTFTVQNSTIKDLVHCVQMHISLAFSLSKTASALLVERKSTLRD